MVELDSADLLEVEVVDITGLLEVVEVVDPPGLLDVVDAVDSAGLLEVVVELEVE